MILTLGTQFPREAPKQLPRPQLRQLCRLLCCPRSPTAFEGYNVGRRRTLFGPGDVKRMVTDIGFLGHKDHNSRCYFFDDFSAFLSKYLPKFSVRGRFAELD